MEPKFPDAPGIVVIGQPHAGEIVALVVDSLKEHGAPTEDIQEFRLALFDGDYQDLRDRAARTVPTVFIG